MKYIKQPNGIFSAYDEKSERYLALNSLPEGRKPNFLPANNAEVVAYLEKINTPRPILEVTMRQARLALLNAGLLDSVQSAIDALPEPTKSQANIEWEYSNTLKRAQPLVAALASQIPLTSVQLDELFAVAATL
jgi:hypothetical protein